MKKRLNLKLVAWLLGTLLIVGVGTHFLHAYQVERNAATLRYLAEEAERDEELDRAAKYYRLFLTHEPSDTEALARYGAIQVKLAHSPKTRFAAMLILEQVVRRDPKRDEVRRQLVELAMHPQLQRFSDAKDHLVYLRGVFPKEGELQWQFGRCEHVLGKYAAAAEAYAAAIKLTPTLLDAYRDLAELQHGQLRKPADALATLGAMVSANPKQAKAWLHRGQYLRIQGSLQTDDEERQKLLVQASTDLAQAAQLAEQDADILLESAHLALARGQVPEARALLTKGAQAHAKDVRFHAAAANLEAKSERLQEAVACLRRGLNELPDNQDLLWALAHLVIQGGALEEAETIEGKLRQKGFPAPLLDCLQARLLVHKNNWLEASRRLEKLRPQLTPFPDAAIQADVLMARCYAQLGDSGQQELAYRRALGVDPLSEAASVGLGEVLLGMGEYDKAFNAFRTAAPRSARARILAAQALISRNLSQPEAQRGWEEVDRFLDQIAQASPDAAEIALLRAEVLAGKDQLAQASDHLSAAIAKHPDKVELWGARAAVLQRQEKWQEAVALLDEAEKKLGKRVELRLARARLCVQRGGDQAAQILQTLTQEAEDFQERDWQQLAKGLAQSWLRIGRKKEAAALYTRLAERDINNLSVRLALFDMALQAGQMDEVQRVLAEIRRIEGEDGTLWRLGEAWRLLRQAREAKQKPADEVRTLLTAVAARRPNASRLALAEAEWEELSGQSEKAIAKYQKAVETGERDPNVLRRLVMLLHERRRYLEADEMLQKLQQPSGQMLSSLGRVAAEIALFKQDTERAIELARKAVTADSKDYREFLWLGQMLGAANKWSEAEPVLRRAVELGEIAPATWIALVQCFVRTEQKSKAEQLLEVAKKKLPADQAPLALAQCYEILDQLDKAGELYEAARKARPTDVAVLRNLTRYALRMRRPQEAEQHLETIVKLQSKSPEEGAWAKRLLAIVSAASGNPHKARHALSLLGISGEAQLRELIAGANSEELRARAIVLASQRNRTEHRQAISILETLVRKDGRVDDRFLLAQLYETVGETRLADEQILSLLAQHAKQTTFLAFRVRSLIDRKKADQAEPYLAQLEKIRPEAYGTLQLRTRLLHAEKKTDQAVALLRKHVDDKPQSVGPVAVFLEELGQIAAAEEMYRKLVDRGEHPEHVLVLATFLGRQKRVDDALKLCATAWKKCPPEKTAGASLEILFVGQGSAEQCRQVADMMEQARTRQPNDTALLGALAAVRRLEGRFPESIALYKELVRREPADALALNNLAWLLVHRENKAKEALGLVQQAIQSAGPMATLLDTRGVIRLALGETNAAIRDLEEVVAETSSVSSLFHLAHAYHRAGQRAAATVAWQRAVAAGLRPASIDSLEMTVYQKLARELAP
ncbi:MAG: tetratricopeptide repeat protein [Gemmataceae bacterium]|nr:tetratricopeptide repeat protein [Gemmataceae bacterium]